MSATDYANRLVERLRDLSSQGDGFIALHEPAFGDLEHEYVTDCLDTGWVSSVGAYVDRFEKELAERCEVVRAVAVSNGTAALQVALLGSGVRPDDEVLAPALTFVATPNAITYSGAVPHFVDSEPVTLGVDVAKLDAYLAAIGEQRTDGLYNRHTGRRVSTIVPMHVFGHPVDMDTLAEVCGRYGINIVEDSAEALGSRYKGRACGALYGIGALSFNGNKIITTGGGGAILTNDAELGARLKHLTTTAKVPHRWAFRHDEVGFNYRLPNLNAALGCAQLTQLDGFLENKRRLAGRYLEGLADFSGLTPVREPDGAQSNYWLNAIMLDDETEAFRDEILDISNAQGIQCRPVWTLMHRLPMYASMPRMDLSQAEKIEARLINIPSSAKLGR